MMNFKKWCSILSSRKRSINLIERLVILHQNETIQLEHLPEKLLRKHSSQSGQIVDLPPDGYSLEDLERDIVVQALERNGWNQTRAADFLKIPRHTIIYRLEKYGIKKPVN